jgi:hypothetical protein
LTSNARNPIRFQFLLRRSDAAVSREPEESLCDGGDVGEPPVFVVSGGEPGCAKAGKRILAQLPQPWQGMAGGELLELAEVL